jgi:AhpD family alkylhydroperoxidase
MATDWAGVLKETQQADALLRKANPAAAKGFDAMRAASHGRGALDEKTRELIAVAVAVTKQCEPCIASHVSKAVKAGATAEELADALGVAMTINAGSSYVQSLEALKAFHAFADKSG